MEHVNVSVKLSYMRNIVDISIIVCDEIINVAVVYQQT